MLYITTRNSADTYTAYKTCISDCGADGGRYVPFRLPQLSQEEIANLKNKTFNEIVAEILNAFFACRMNSGDLDLDIGETPLQLVPMNHKLVVAQMWHNRQADFNYIVETLYNKICQSEEIHSAPTDWVCIAVRISVIFGIYGQMLKDELIEPEQAFDFSIYNDCFTTPIAVWYCRQMGLPINMIVCTNEEDSNIWDFIHRGVFASAAANKDLCLGLERLIFGTLGREEVNNFAEAYQNGKVYSVEEENLAAFNKGFFCAVAGKNRASATINSLFRSNSYIIDPTSALCFAGLQDYRARTGSNSLTVLLAERTPLDFSDEICEATGISADKLTDYVKLK